jgi:hypothetical protein
MIKLSGMRSPHWVRFGRRAPRRAAERAVEKLLPLRSTNCRQRALPSRPPRETSRPSGIRRTSYRARRCPQNVIGLRNCSTPVLTRRKQVLYFIDVGFSPAACVALRVILPCPQALRTDSAAAEGRLFELTRASKGTRASFHSTPGFAKWVSSVGGSPAS